MKAIVVRKPGRSVTEEDLIQFCKEKKGTVIVPKTAEFLSEIPLTPLGKPDKVVLRQRSWKDRARFSHRIQDILFEDPRFPKNFQD